MLLVRAKRTWTNRFLLISFSPPMPSRLAAASFEIKLAPELAPDSSGLLGKSSHDWPKTVEKTRGNLTRRDAAGQRDTAARALANRRLQPLGHVSV